MGSKYDHKNNDDNQVNIEWPELETPTPTMQKRSQRQPLLQYLQEEVINDKN